MRLFPLKARCTCREVRNKECNCRELDIVRGWEDFYCGKCGHMLGAAFFDTLFKYNAPLRKQFISRYAMRIKKKLRKAGFTAKDKREMLSSFEKRLRGCFKDGIETIEDALFER